jgi:hypothetical protein
MLTLLDLKIQDLEIVNLKTKRFYDLVFISREGQDLRVHIWANLKTFLTQYVIDLVIQFPSM